MKKQKTKEKVEKIEEKKVEKAEEKVEKKKEVKEVKKVENVEEEILKSAATELNEILFAGEKKLFVGKKRGIEGLKRDIIEASSELTDDDEVSNELAGVIKFLLKKEEKKEGKKEEKKEGKKEEKKKKEAKGEVKKEEKKKKKDACGFKIGSKRHFFALALAKGATSFSEIHAQDWNDGKMRFKKTWAVIVKKAFGEVDKKGNLCLNAKIAQQMLK